MISIITESMIIFNAVLIKKILEIKVKYARYSLAQVNERIINREQSVELEDERTELAKVVKKNI